MRSGILVGAGKLGRTLVILGVLGSLCLGVLALTGAEWPSGRAAAAVAVAGGEQPPPQDYVDLRTVAPAAPAPPNGPDASTGSFAEDCGRNAEGHRNSDNVVTSPGITDGAHHTHDYVGNLSTNAFSTDASLEAAPTTCTDGDRSTFYWPVLRRLDRSGGPGSGAHGNTGRILEPVSVRVEFRGSPVSPVVPMPHGLRLLTGDPVAATSDGSLTRAAWGCSGLPGRSTELYPRCPEGSRLTRTLDFPSCWDGLHTDSPDHRDHAVFPAANGVCPHGTFAVPQLRVVVAYEMPSGAPFALDSFPEQRRSPVTEHAVFVDEMSDRQMARVADCLNQGRRC
ncbi:DUF1996 domain-containing protein [Peterkaempfera bronchialis]|uniref:DUF1996 domain-containing protein n=1 Tax=Peterkaempfera bronchialis TaxID=2126346 RepID=UPI003C2AE5F0